MFLALALTFENAAINTSLHTVTIQQKPYIYHMSTGSTSTHNYAYIYDYEST